MSGIVFIVDAWDRERIPEARNELQGLLTIEELANTPIVVLANKIDKVGAMVQWERMNSSNRLIFSILLVKSCQKHLQAFVHLNHSCARLLNVLDMVRLLSGSPSRYNEHSFKILNKQFISISLPSPHHPAACTSVPVVAMTIFST